MREVRFIIKHNIREKFNISFDILRVEGLSPQMKISGAVVTGSFLFQRALVNNKL
jgi:hypothetical protein